MLTAIAATFTARSQYCALGEEQCVMMRDDSARVISDSRYCNTSPAQSSNNSKMGSVLAPRWTMKALRAHVKIKLRALEGAQKKDASSWYSCRNSALAGTKSLNPECVAQCACAAE